MQITLRDYQKEDFKELQAIVRKTWHYDEFCSPKTAAKLAGVFLSSCLTNHTFSRIALLNNKPVGIILVKNRAIHKCPVKYRLKQIESILSLYLSKEGRKVSKIFGSVNGIDKQLLADVNKSYPAELSLFAVDCSCRGKGIGKQLFNAALEYLKEQKLNEFYLFTDTSCKAWIVRKKKNGHAGLPRRSRTGMKTCAHMSETYAATIWGVGYRFKL